jgi:hypothetical protein
LPYDCFPKTICFLMKEIAVKLNLNELAILTYVLSRRSELGPYAESAHRKLGKAERELLRESQVDTEAGGEGSQCKEMSPPNP